jgi:lysozyme
MSVLLADYSQFQERVNWNIAAEKLDGAWIRATQGMDDVDDKLFENVEGSSRKDLYRGFYHVYKSAYTGIGQGKFFLNHLPAQYELPCIIDVEIPDTIGNFSEYERRLRELLLYVEVHTGKRPLIYTNYDFWTNNLSGRLWASQYSLFIAFYGNYPPLIPADWSNWLFWQYTDSGDGPTYGASSTHIDLDRFNGNRKQFEYWIRKVNSNTPMPREQYLKWTMICPASATKKQKEAVINYALNRGRTFSFSYDSADWGIGELLYLDSGIHNEFVNWYNLNYPNTKVIFSSI